MSVREALSDKSQCDCVYEQVAKADCECPVYRNKSVKTCRNRKERAYGTDK